jgi:hypothetical protein
MLTIILWLSALRFCSTPADEAKAKLYAQSFEIEHPRLYLDKIYLTKLTNLPLSINLSLLISNLFDSCYFRPNYLVRYLPCYHRGLSKLLFGCFLLLIGVVVVLLLFYDTTSWIQRPTLRTLLSAFDLIALPPMARHQSPRCLWPRTILTHMSRHSKYKSQPFSHGSLNLTFCCLPNCYINRANFRKWKI